MPNEKVIRSILIIRSGALGDTVYATVVLDALIKEYGESVRIDWIGTPLTRSLFKYDSRVHSVITLKHRKLPAIINPEKRRIIAHSKKEPYDLLLNLELGTQFNDLAQAVHARIKHGFPFTRPTITDHAIHMVELIRLIYKDLLNNEEARNAYPKLVGEPFEPVKTKYALPSEYLVIAPSNSHTNRDKINYRAWPAEKWKALIHALAPGKNLVLIGNQGEEAYFKSLQPYPENVIDLNGKTNLTELITIISQAKSLITTDTGPAHIASATSTPVHCLIGPTDANSTGPYKTPNNEVHIISKQLECSPCYNLPRRDQCTDNICMKEITVEDVLHSLKSGK